MTGPSRSPDAVAAGSRAVVVFSGETDLWKLRPLKCGFRHCCALVEAGRFWIFYNPTSRAMEIRVFDHLSLGDIAGWFLDRGHTVICCRVRPAPAAPAPVRAFTCVEAVKRLLGVHAPWALTPWQLFWHMTAAAKTVR